MWAGIGLNRIGVAMGMTRKLSTIFLVGLAVSSCSSSRFAVKADLVKSWSEKLIAEKPNSYPFTVEYKSDDKLLTFIGVQHANWATSKSFKVIDEALKSQRYDLLIVETLPSSFGFSSKEMILRAQSDGKNGFFKGGEASFAIDRAAHLGLLFTGTEPSDDEVAQSLMRIGYSDRDIVHFFFLRQIFTYNRDGSLLKKTIEQLFAEFGDAATGRFKVPKNDERNFADFLDWYHEKNNQIFNLKAISQSITSPLIDGAFFTQKLAANIGKERDIYSLKILSKALAKYNRILVVSGGDRWITQKRVISGWLGAPVSKE